MDKISRGTFYGESVDAALPRPKNLAQVPPRAHVKLSRQLQSQRRPDRCDAHKKTERENALKNNKRQQRIDVHSIAKCDTVRNLLERRARGNGGEN